MFSCLTWNEIKNNYPDEWVSIIEPETLQGKGLIKGTVIAHHKNKKEVAKLAKKRFIDGLEFKVHTLRYTGEIPNIVGLGTIDFEKF